jgi:hypothetical protein
VSTCRPASVIFMRATSIVASTAVHLLGLRRCQTGDAQIDQQLDAKQLRPQLNKIVRWPVSKQHTASARCGPSSAGTSIGRRRWPDKSGLLEVVMTDNRARNGTLGAILGALIAVAFAVFLLNGGEHVGKKTVKSDADLPPVATGQPR